MATTSSQEQIPHTAIKYTQLTSASEWNGVCLKFQTPKSVRRKVISVIVVIAICSIMIIYSCVNCEPSCTSYCHVWKHGGTMENTNLANTSVTTPPPHTGAWKQRFPKAIIIGVRKAGTRALLTYLNMHPDIVQCAKELHFFDSDEKYQNGLEYYRTMMPYSYGDQLTIEKTPAYFIDVLAPERIYRMNSSIRLLLIVREPVTRAISDYEQLRLKATTSKSSFERLALHRNGDVNLSYKPMQISMYYKHFPHWLEFFDRSQIHIVDGDKLISNPYPHVHDIETFLGLGHKITPDMFYFNQTKGFYCSTDHNRQPLCLGKSKGRPHSHVDERVVHKLQSFYRPKNERFFQMVNMTFDWP